jgi:hypothetical protein
MITRINEEPLRDEYIAEDREGVLMEAGDPASDQDQITFITDAAGKRLFAVVPVEFAERALSREML